MPATRTEINELDHGYEYVILEGMEAFYDENNERVLGPPENIVKGWCRFESEADDAIRDYFAEDEQAS